MKRMRNSATGKFTKKLYAVLGLGAALAVLLACAVFGVVPRGRTARAVSDAAGLTQAIAAAPTDYLTAQTVAVGAADGANGVEIEVTDNITVKAGSRVHFTATDPSVVNALTRSAVDSHIVFSGSVTVEANAEVTFDCDVTFKGEVSVRGTMIVNGMALNQNTFTVQNELHDYSAIRSQGLIVGGAFNNDGANNGKLVVAQGANITVSGHSAQSVQGQQVAYDGGALFLKAASQTDLAFTNDGALAAEGTVIYDNAFTGTAPDGAQGATFVSSYDNYTSGGPYVFYSASSAGDQTVALSQAVPLAATWLSFGRTTFTANANGMLSVAQTANLGGYVQDGKTYTQGANKLIFDGGAVWTAGSAGYSDYTLYFTVGDDASVGARYRNTGVSANAPLIRVGSSTARSGATLNVYGGVSVVYRENGRTNGNAYDMGGGIAVVSLPSNNGGALSSDAAILNLYGGEVAYNAVTRRANEGAGAGVYAYFSNVNVYDCFITRNALGNYGVSSGDGAGVAIDACILTMYGGEISYNRGTTGSAGDVGADGGGIIARSESSTNVSLLRSQVNLHGGAVKGNYTGGSGGGILLWQSVLNMTGGEISQNYAAFGGGVGATADGTRSEITVSGGTISENLAAYNSTIRTGGYGAGLCVGSNQFSSYSFVTMSGGTISGNRAVANGGQPGYGGGMAVYTEATANNNTLTMSGGLITGNTASASQNGNGVYVRNKSTASPAKSLLSLSGTASIDTSNNVSFSYARIPSEAVAPIEVTGELTGTGLAAFVRLENASNWIGRDIISYKNNVTPNVNKFLLDDETYSFTEVGGALQITAAQASVAQAYDAGGTLIGAYSTIEAAFDAVPDGGRVVILQSTLLKQSITVNKNVTLTVNGTDVTLGVATDFTYGSVANPAIFLVDAGHAFTIDAGSGKITIDGNSSASRGLSIVSVRGGSSYTQQGEVVLANNRSTEAGSAIYLSENATANLNGGTIRNNEGRLGAVYVSGSAVLNLSGEVAFSENRDVSVTDETRRYGVWLASSSSQFNINGTLALEGGDALYSEGVITIGEQFVLPQSGTTYGISFSAQSDAGKTVVTVSQAFIEAYIQANGGTSADAVNAVYGLLRVVHMAEDFELAVGSGAGTGTSASDIVVSKSVVFLFRYGSDVTYGDFATVVDSLPVYNAAFTGEGVVSLRAPDTVAVQVRYASSFNLSSLSLTGYASRKGYTLIRWEYGDTYFAYNEGIPFVNSQAEIVVSAVWVANTYRISYDGNYADVPGATPGSVLGSMDTDEFSYGSSGTAATLTHINFAVVGWAFCGWTLTAAGDGTVFADEAAFSDLDEALLQIAEPTAYERDENGMIVRAVYAQTVYAQWTPVFGAASGAGTSQETAFIISDLSDLYMLEATVNGMTYNKNASGTEADRPVFVTGGAAVQTVSVGGSTYYNAVTDAGAVYTANAYEGYFFKVTANIAGFAGTIGRVSDAAFTSEEIAQNAEIFDAAVTEPHERQERRISYAVYGSDAAAETGGAGTALGTPFKGTFDGQDHTVTLAVNKQKTESGWQEGGGFEEYVNGDETLVGAGLFGYTDHAALRNVKLAGSVHGYAHVGALVGYTYGGTIENIVNAASVTSGGHDVGGMVGTFYELPASYTRSSVTNVVNTGAVRYTPRENEDRARVLDAQADWNELSIMKDSEGIRFGGIVGAAVTLRLNGGYNAGNITARYGVGGVVGTLRSGNNATLDDAYIQNSFNAGSVLATSGLFAVSQSPDGTAGAFITAYTGGVVGRLVGASRVELSFNAGRVMADAVAEFTGVSSVADLTQDGMAAAVAQNTGIGAYSCVSVAPDAADRGVYLGARGVGGVVGFTSYNTAESNPSGRKSVARVYNTGAVSAWSAVGGIAGYFAYSELTHAYNGGNVTATGTHYDEESGVREPGGFGGEVSFLGAIVGRGINATVSSSVYYNTDSVYTGYTDATVQAIGDTEYGLDIGFNGNTSNASGLTSSQMRIVTDGSAPVGFGTSFDTTGWVFRAYGGGKDNYSYYPQLAAFCDNATPIGTVVVNGQTLADATVGDISRAGVQIMFRNDAGEDRPVTDEERFRVTFVLGGGTFALAQGTASGETPETFYYFDRNANGGYDAPEYLPVGEETSENFNRFNDGAKYYTNERGEYYYTVSLGSQYIGDAVEAAGGAIEVPVAPTRTGYTFGGWYTTSSCTEGTEFDFGSVPASNVVVYAKWDVIVYNIIYENVTGLGGVWQEGYNRTFSIQDVPQTGEGWLSLPGSNYVSRRGYSLAAWLYQNNSAVSEYRVRLTEDGMPYLQLRTPTGELIDISFEDLANGLALSAQWTATEYDLYYTVPDGTELTETAPVTQAKYTTEVMTPLLSDYPAYGQRFIGWQLAAFDDSDAQNNRLLTLNEIYAALPEGVVGDVTFLAVYEPIEYTLTFHVGNGTIADYVENNLAQYGLVFNAIEGVYTLALEYGDAIPEALKGILAQPNEAGRAFRFWSSNASSGSDEYQVDLDSFVMGYANRTLYAYYEVATYTVTVDLGSKLDEGISLSYPNATAMQSLGFVQSAENADIWTTQATYGSDLSAKLTSFFALVTISGQSYHLLHWANTEGAAANVYNITGEMTIYALYSRDQVVVNIVGFNGNTVTTISVGVGDGLAEDDIAALQGLEKEEVPGYTFKYWSLTPNGEEYDPYSDTFSAATTIYARYDPVQLTVQYYLTVNGVGTAVTYTGSGAYYYGSAFGSFPLLEEFTVPSSIDALGMYIASWSVRDGSGTSMTVNLNTVITDHAAFITAGANNEFTVTLYGELGYVDYALTFLAGDGAFAGGGQTASGTYSYAPGAGIRIPALAARTGYVHSGWTYRTETGTETTVVCAEGESYAAALLRMLKADRATGSVTVTARWERQTFEVWYDAGEEGAFTVEDTAEGTFRDAEGQVIEAGLQATARYFVIEVYYGTVPTVSQRPVRTGWNWTGWTHSGGIGAVTSDAYSKDSPIAAQYSQVTYSITYILDNGTLNTALYSYTYPSEQELPKPTRTGYTFGGWYTSATYAGDALTSLNGLSENLLLYAKWDANQVNITISVTDAPDPVGTTYTKDYLETQLGIVVSSYSFADGTLTAAFAVDYGTDLSALNGIFERVTHGDTTYVPGGWQSDGTAVYFGAATANGAYTMAYTQQSASAGVTVVYHYDDTRIYTTLYDQHDSAPLFDLSREGYRFDGWWDREEGGMQYTQSISLTDQTGGTELHVYAHWTPLEYTITLQYNCDKSGITGDDLWDTDSVSYGTALLGHLPDNMTRAGYTFVGWFTDYGLEVPVGEDSTMPAQNIMLYAKWEAVSYRINFYFGNVEDSYSVPSFTQTASFGTALRIPAADNASVPYYEYEWTVRRDGNSVVFTNNGTMPILDQAFAGYTYEVQDGEQTILCIDVYAEYTPISYRIAYWSEQNTNLGSLTFTVRDAGGAWTALKSDYQVTNEGYLFGGWYFISQSQSHGPYRYYRIVNDASHGLRFELAVSQDGSEANAYAVTALGQSAYFRVYEQPQQYRVTLDAEGGALSGSDTITVTYAATFGQLPVPARTGYLFSGWYTATEGGLRIVETTVVSSSSLPSDNTLHAQWTPITYNVLFIGNGGTGSMNMQSVAYDQAYSLPQNGFIRPGYTFAGWKVKNRGETLAAGTSVQNLTGAQGDYVEIWAQWTAVTTTIVFYPNGGSGAMESQTLTYPDHLKLPENTFTRTGWHFVGWATNASGAVVYANGAYVGGITDATYNLYAVWHKNTYTVVFNGNGGEGSMTPQSLEYDASANLTKNDFMRTGYTFAGWATSAGGEVEYSDQASISGLSAGNGATVNLYAVWTINKYTITFDAGQGTFSATGLTATDTIEIEVEHGKNAWSALYERYSDLTIDPPQNMYVLGFADEAYEKLFHVTAEGTFSVQYSETQTSLVLIYPDGTHSIVTVTVNGTVPAGELNYTIPDGSGYTSYRWVSVADGSVVTDQTSIASFTICRLDLTGGKQITVTLDPQSGTLGEGESAERIVTYGSAYGALPVPAREGYTFAGWYTAETDGERVYDVTMVSNTADHALYARWTVNQYTVAFFVDGQKVYEQSVDFGAEVVSHTYTPAHGYEVSVWKVYDESSQTYVAYAFEDSAMPAGTLYLYAETSPRTVTVTLNAGSGTVTPESVSAPYNALYAEAGLPEPAREGYTFAGWSLDGAIALAADARILPEGDMAVTLIALWQINRYIVTLNVDGVTTAVAPKDGLHLCVLVACRGRRAVRYNAGHGDRKHLAVCRLDGKYLYHSLCRRLARTYAGGRYGSVAGNDFGKALYGYGNTG